LKLSSETKKSKGKTSEVLNDEITEKLKGKDISKKEPEEVELPPVPITDLRH